jgi:hypothetical protein
LVGREDVAEGKRQAEQTVRKARPWVVRLARAGYVAKGVVYAVIGVLALRQAFGSGGQTTGTSGAVESVGSRPLGSLLLVLLALGLLGYTVWKFTQAIMDTEHKGSDAKGIGRRVAYAGSGLIHGGLALTAATVISSGSSGGSSSDDWTAQLMSVPLGRVLVALVGLGVLVVAIYQLHAALTAKFRRDLMLGQMRPAVEKWSTRAGSAGTAARAVVIAVAGLFVMLAAYQSDPQETRGLGGALQSVSNQPFGPYLLGAVALGLILYALFMLVVARYRRVDTT